MVNIIKDFVAINHYHRDGVKLRKFRGVTIHETGNTSNGSNALAHRNYAHNLVKNNVQSYIGYHYFVDDKEAYLITPTDERVWINGDGNTGTGNNETVSIEICVNPDGSFTKATDNASWLAAYELSQHGIEKVIDGLKDKKNGNLFQHFSWSGKNCPQTIRQTNQWDAFVSKTQKYLTEIWTPTVTEKQYFKINTDYNDGKWNATQKGAFEYNQNTRTENLDKAIAFYEANNLSNEYKIFDTKDGSVVYPLNKDCSEHIAKIKELEFVIENLVKENSDLKSANQKHQLDLDTSLSNMNELIDKIEKVKAVLR